MAFSPVYVEDEPTRDEIDARPGLVLLEFGAGWCGHCLALAPALEAVLKQRPDVEHIRIADARGKRLGRSFRVKLWPTLVLLRDGRVLHELVRPTSEEVRQVFEQLAPQ